MRPIWLAVLRFNSGCRLLISLKDLFFIMSIGVCYSRSYLLLLKQSSEFSFFPDLTVHAHHGFRAKLKRCIRAGLQVALKCIAPAKILVPFLLRTNIRPLYTKLPDLSLIVRSRKHVYACLAYIQESWLNLTVTDTLTSIQGFDL